MTEPTHPTEPMPDEETSAAPVVADDVAQVAEADEAAPPGAAQGAPVGAPEGAEGQPVEPEGGPVGAAEGAPEGAAVTASAGDEAAVEQPATPVPDEIVAEDPAAQGELAVETVATQEPVAAEGAVAEEPAGAATDEPVEEPTDEEPAAQEPAADQASATATDESVEEPADQAPAAQEPAADQTSAASTDESVEVPADQAPTAQELGADQTSAATTDGPVEEPAAPELVDEQPSETATGESVQEPAAEAEAEATEPPAADAAPAAPRPAPPKPGPRPTPAALRTAPHAAPVPVAPTYSGPPAESFGRVEDDGTVYVRVGEAERSVGAYPGATPDEALHYFARKFDELWASVDLLHQRVVGTDISAKDAADALGKLKETTTEPHVVGDLAQLDTHVAEIEAAVAERRAAEGAERAAAKAAARTEREKLVVEAEKLAGQPEEKIQWKSSGARMRELLDEWKKQQRSGPRLDRESESTLWQRFSHARNGFDKARRVHFAQLESTQGEAKSLKQKLVSEAQDLAKSKDWGPTASSFKRLMDRWRQAGRASRTDDDALWAQFKAAQDSFFAAKDEIVAAEDAEFNANLEVKEKLLLEAEAILPVKDLETAKAALRTVQDKWEKAGKIPRGDIQRIEQGLRKVETAVRDVEEQRWKRSNPEVAARAQSMVDQLESSVASLKETLAKAEASGNEKKVAEARAKLQAQEQWLNQARSGLEEFSG